MRSIDRLIRWLGQVANVIGNAVLLGTGVFIVTNIVLRYFFRKPIDGSVELVELFLAITIFLGFTYTTRVRGHIAADFLTDHLPARLRNAVELLVTFLSALAAAAMSYALWAVGTGRGAGTEVTMELQIHTQPIRILGAAAMALVVCELLMQCVKLVVAIVKRKEPDL